MGFRSNRRNRTVPSAQVLHLPLFQLDFLAGVSLGTGIVWIGATSDQAKVPLFIAFFIGKPNAHVVRRRYGAHGVIVLVTNRTIRARRRFTLSAFPTADLPECTKEIAHTPQFDTTPLVTSHGRGLAVGIHLAP